MVTREPVKQGGTGWVCEFCYDSVEIYFIFRYNCDLTMTPERYFIGLFLVRDTYVLFISILLVAPVALSAKKSRILK